MGAPANYPLTVRTGDTETVTVTLQDSAGAAVNITGRTYQAQIRDTAASTAVLATFTCSVTNGTAGIFACTLGTATTAALSPQTAVWDCQETTAGGVVSTLLAGQVWVVQDVTR
jgi:hypothetical protein